MEPTPSIKAFTHDGLSPAVKSLHRLYLLLRKIPELPTIPKSEEFDPKSLAKHYGFNKLSDIPDKECDIFKPFGGNYPILAYTLLCFVFEEETKWHPNPKLSWFPPSCFPSLLYIPLSKPPKNLPPSTGIDHLKDQIKCILHYEDFIDEICNDQLPIYQVQQQQQPEELSVAEMLANEVWKALAQQKILAHQEMLAHQSQEDASTDKLMKGPTDKKLKCLLSLPALKQQMSGSVRK